MMVAVAGFGQERRQRHQVGSDLRRAQRDQRCVFVDRRVWRPLDTCTCATPLQVALRARDRCVARWTPTEEKSADGQGGHTDQDGKPDEQTSYPIRRCSFDGRCNRSW
jgi:hypothetical protein